MFRSPLAMLLVIFSLLCVTAAFGQFPPGDHGQGGPPMGPGGFFMGPGQGGERGGDRGGRMGHGGDRGERMGRGGDFGGRRGGGGSDRSSRFEGFLRQMDTNGDGVIQESEVPEERRGMLRMISARFGQDPAAGLSLDRLRETMAAQRGDHNPSPTDGSAAQPTDPNNKSKQEPPLVPGFGIDEPLIPVIGFGVRAKPASRIVLGSEPKIDPQVRAMFDRFDRDHNGTIEREEFSILPGNLRSFDLNQDNRITLAEVAARIAQVQREQNQGSNQRGRGDDEEEDESDDASSNDKRERSYRFLSPHERLPKGVPDWFVNRDADFDGQVTMAEFAGYWTHSAVEEFFKYDANRDGMITPAESLAPNSAASSPGASTAGRPSNTPPAAPPEKSEPSTPWWMQ